MVTALSSTGLDLSRHDDFLEFWLFQPVGEPADSAGLRLVIDLGTVNEDALAIAPDTWTVNGTDSTYRAASTSDSASSTPSGPTSGSSTRTWTTSASWRTGPTRCEESARARSANSRSASGC